MLFAAAIWGFAFVAQRMGAAHVGPFTFNGIRFALGALALAPVMAALRSRATLPASRRIIYGAITGSVLFTAASLQQVGIVYTTAGNAGFITGLYVVIVPILGVFRRQRITRGAILGVGLATAGMYLLTVKENLSIGVGDFAILVGAFFWAIHVQLIDKFIKKIDALELAFIQSVTCAGLSLMVGLWREPITLSAVRLAALPLFYAGVCSVGVAYTLQVVAQKRVPPTHAAIILSMESVFAVLGGWLILSEEMSIRGFLGCALMLAGMISAHVVKRRPRTEQGHG